MLLKDQVVLITGAGNGIGRAYALAFAAAGARVVVNDLGGARDGDGASDAPARTVVQEIVAFGGDAIADFGNVTVPADCARMVEAAVTRWGRLDTIVNNAGVLRDRTFSKLTDEEWDIVVAVHLTGTRNVVRAALPALSRAGGSIINTTSYSGMIGNFGQANYAAAKAGIYGFTRVLAVELQRRPAVPGAHRLVRDAGREGVLEFAVRHVQLVQTQPLVSVRLEVLQGLGGVVRPQHERDNGLGGRQRRVVEDGERALDRL